MINKKIALVIFFIVLILTSVLSYVFLESANVSVLSSRIVGDKNSKELKETTPSIPANESKTEECPLNGQYYSQAQRSKWESRRPLGIMVENHTEARPQSGLSSADVIYEAVAEGGITRFLGLFYCQDASYVGPVRSARIYFIKLLQEYGLYPLYAHVGGANTDGPADALGEIDELGWGSYNDLNQFSVPFPNYWRDYERLPNRATEHTVYSATEKLWDFARTKRGLSNKDKKGNQWNESFTLWKFKDDTKKDERGKVGKINFGFWNLFAADYAVSWVYDLNSNSYRRENGGQPHIDKYTGKQLEAKNIMVVLANESSANDGYAGGHVLYKLTGSGDGTLFQDGVATTITWTKKDEESRMQFSDENGNEISFVRGQTWVEILPVGNKVTY